MLREERGIGAQVLTHAGASVDAVRREVLHLLSAGTLEDAMRSARLRIAAVRIEVEFADGATARRQFSSTAAAVSFLNEQL
jgi:hypothetical protein